MILRRIVQKHRKVCVAATAFGWSTSCIDWVGLRSLDNDPCVRNKPPANSGHYLLITLARLLSINGKKDICEMVWKERATERFVFQLQSYRHTTPPSQDSEASQVSPLLSSQTIFSTDYKCRDRCLESVMRQGKKTTLDDERERESIRECRQRKTKPITHVARVEVDDSETMQTRKN